jgi:hypothetical protein
MQLAALALIRVPSKSDSGVLGDDILHRHISGEGVFGTEIVCLVASAANEED